MRIIIKGQLPGTKVYKGRCDNCKTVFEFTRVDATLRQTGYNETSLVVSCPLEGCAKDVYVQP